MEKSLRGKPEKPVPEKAESLSGGVEVSDQELAGRLNSLDKRLDAKQDNKRLDAKQDKLTAAGAAKPDNAGFAAAMRLSTDFVAAILLGAALGYGLDRLLGITPWGMIIFLVLGFGAGVLSVLRTAGKLADPHAKQAKTGRPDMYDDEDE